MREMRAFTIACLTTFALALSAPASAFDQGEGGYFYSGNKLHEMCRNTPSMAMSYIIGTYDGAQYMAAYLQKGHSPFTFCAPANSVTTQYRDIVCRFVDEHPAKRASSAFTLVSEALEEAWPCPSSAF